MSTSCLIGAKVGDKIESIRCHWDGYPRGKNSVGEILKTHYTDPDKIASLMELGDISSLGYEPVEDLDGWNPAVSSCDHTKCVAYRTRGETDIDKQVSDDEAAYIDMRIILISTLRICSEMVNGTCYAEDQENLKSFKNS